MSDFLAIQDNLLKASAEELLRTDLLHMTTKEQNIHKEYFLTFEYRIKVFVHPHTVYHKLYNS